VLSDCEPTQTQITGNIPNNEVNNLMDNANMFLNRFKEKKN